MNLYQAFLQSVEKHAEPPALLWNEDRMSYSELANQVQACINWICEQPVTDPPHVGLLAPNTPYYAIAFFALLGAGRVVVPWNPLMQLREVATLAKHAQLQLMLFDPALEPLARAVQNETENKLTVKAIPDAVREGASLPKSTPQLPDPDSNATVLYTSGTTGDPKGVMLTHRNLFSNYKSYVSVFDFNPSHTFLTVLPLFHSYGLTTNLLGALLSGAKMRLFVQFDPHALLRSMSTERELVLTAVPPMFHFLARRAPEDIAETHGVAYAVSGGGPLPLDVLHLYESRFEMELLEGYGLTETSPVVAVNRAGDNRPGTIGLPLPDVEVTVRGGDGNDLPPGEVGELNIRGDLVMKGYYRAPEMTADVLMPDGWFRSGDLASIDEEGYIRIVGRLKDLIVDSGENIYPREIEEILLRHPSVVDAAVVGHPHHVRSEVPHAFVVLDHEQPDPPTEKELRAYCRENLAKYNVPELFTIRTDLPKTATNKTRKEILRKELKMLD